MRRRVPVQFGKTAPLREGGFTVNISPRGLGIISPQVHPPGTRLTVELRLPSGERACVEGTVVWAQRGMPQLGMPGSMGLRLNTLHAGVVRYVSGAQTPQAPEPPSVLVVPPPPGLFVPPPPEPPVAAAPDPEPEPAVASATPPRVPGPRLPRFRDLLPVRYGTSRDVLACRGFTADVSRTGVQLSAHVVAMKGVRLQVAVSMPDGRVARADGQVVWSKRGDGETPGAMGVALSSTDGLWLQLVDDAARSGTR